MLGEMEPALERAVNLSSVELGRATWPFSPAVIRELQEAVAQFLR